jgi:hypothetical protein
MGETGTEIKLDLITAYKNLQNEKSLKMSNPRTESKLAEAQYTEC